MHKILFGLTVALVLAVSSGSTRAQESLEGQQAPTWTLSNLAGQQRHFPQDYTGTKTVILFWATWCPYCSALMPYLAQIEKDYADQDVRVLALNFKEDGDPEEHMRRLGFDFEVFLEADEVAQEYGARYSPGLYVIDEHGIVRFHRRSTDQRPGKAIAEYWSYQVRGALDTRTKPAESD